MKKRIYISLILTIFALGALTACGRSPEIIWEETQGNLARASGGLPEEALRSDDGKADTTGANAREQDMTGGQIQEADTAAQETPYMVIDICGAVARPGVYFLREGARVCDAVALAGGLLPEADVRALNQAALLKDGDKIIVCTADETAQAAGFANAFAGSAGTVSATAGAVNAGNAADKVNINTADVQQLCTLSGIGESRAQDIIAYRTVNGAFAAIEDIMKVSGIKQATFSKIKDDITVG